MSNQQTTNPVSEAKESAAEVKENVKESVAETKENAAQAKEDAAQAVPTPPSQQMPESSAQAVKSRLQWGEPAMTILDVRDRTAFNQGRITGAIPMPIGELSDRAAASLETQREIYVYGDNDKQSNEAASQLREAGFESVSILKGGLTAWKAVSGATEGPTEQR